MSTANTKAVYAVLERGGGAVARHIRIGSAEVNEDGSIAVRLDAIPVSGKLLIEDMKPQREGNA